MSDIDDVLERLVTDEGFRAELAVDPATALTGYSLDEDDLDLLAATLDEGVVEEHGVEQRTSKSAMFGLIAGLADGGGGSSPTTGAGPAGLRSDGELVQASVSPDAPAPVPDEGSRGAGAQDEVNSKEYTDTWSTAVSPPEGPADVRGLPHDDTEADPSTPAYDTIELVPHTITYAEPTGAGPNGETDLGAGSPPDDGVEPEQSAPADTLIGKITPKPLTEEPEAGVGDGTSEESAGVEGTEPGLNAYASLTWNGDALEGDDAGSDLAGNAHSSYQERVANEAFVAQPDTPGDAEGNDVSIETVVIQDERVDLEPDADVGANEKETIGANRGETGKGSTIEES